MVVLLFDTSDPRACWLNRDYLPEFGALRSVRILASVRELAGVVSARLEPVPIPWDCADGFYEAHRRLRADLGSGRWAERNHALLDLDEAELGARLLIA